MSRKKRDSLRGGGIEARQQHGGAILKPSRDLPPREPPCGTPLSPCRVSDIRRRGLVSRVGGGSEQGGAMGGAYVLQARSSLRSWLRARKKWMGVLYRKS